MRSQVLDGRPTATGDDRAEERALDDIARQLARAYPAAPQDRIAAMLWAAYDATRDSKVQNYRLVLAERNCRARLRHEQRNSGDGTGGRHRLT